MKKISSILITMAMVLPATLIAQAPDDTTSMKSRPFQVGFVTPLGTNGINSGRISNNFSVNLLAGYSGGLDGVEFSGLGSVLMGNMTGAQFAGLANINAGKTKGFQASGIANISTDSTTGLLLTGAVNYAHGAKASQISGFVNITDGDNKGFQMAGFLNISSNKHSGTQVAGFLNYAKKLKGVQIGVFNYVDSLERGIPVGFLSFVKNGYCAFEIGSTETLYGVMSFKTGTKKFYNILSVGGGYREGFSLFAWGYGLGAFIPVSNKTGLSIDGICYQVNEDEWFTNRLNLLNKLNLNVSWMIAKHLSIYGGLSWNVTVSDITDDYGDPVTSHIAPFSVFSEIYEDHLEVKMYPGISAGIRL